MLPHVGISHDWRVTAPADELPLMRTTPAAATFADANGLKNARA
jgi:hypothetical protein